MNTNININIGEKSNPHAEGMYFRIGDNVLSDISSTN